MRILQSWTLRTLVGCLCLASIGLSCGGGEEGPPESAVSQFLSDRNDLVGRALCQMPYRCQDRPPHVTRYRTAEGCLDDLDLDAPVFTTGPTVTSWREGRLDFSQQMADRCLDRLEARLEAGECLTINPGLDELEVDACHQVFSGTISSGEPCIPDRNTCQGGLTCIRDTSDEGNSDCWGTCQQPSSFVGQGKECGAEDERCNPDKDLVCAPAKQQSPYVCLKRASVSAGEECVVDAVCQAGHVCSEGTCQAFELVGQGKTCDQEVDYCKPGWTCQGLYGGNEEGTCEGFTQKGDTCQSSLECARGLYCTQGDAGAGERVCESLDGNGEECQDGSCDSGLVCRPLSSGRKVCQFETQTTCQLPN